MYKILIVEDCSYTGPLLLKYTNQELARLVTRPEIGADPHNFVTGDTFKEAANEPAQGQLFQLRHVFQHVEQHLRDESLPLNVYPEAKLFPPSKLGTLKELARQYVPDVMSSGDPAAQALRAAVNSECVADVIVVDLALDGTEGQTVVDRGGLVGFRAPVEDAPAGGAQASAGDLPDGRQELPDPRPELRRLTGFRILAAFADFLPVIATSYLSNPLIRQHCIVNGAVGFIAKPVESKDKTGNGLDFLSVTPAATDRELSAKENDDVLDVVVTNYLTEAVAEIVKALGLRWLWKTAPSFPRAARPLYGSTTSPD